MTLYYEPRAWGRGFSLAYARANAYLRADEAAAKRLAHEETKYDRYVSARPDFAELLARKDRGQAVKRIFVMGCGRSGTWLLYALLSMAKDAHVLFEEVDVGRFGRIASPEPVHILKRDQKSYVTAASIPASISVVWIVRHPFDVVTSRHPEKTWKIPFHIDAKRWNGEMDALRHFLEERRPNGLVVRYEDLVNSPEPTMSRIAGAFGLELSASIGEFADRAQVPANVREIMHGLRSIAPQSVERWRSDPELVRRVHDIVPQIAERLDWASQCFGYDVSLPELPARRVSA
jgi:hypothetical protein